MGDPVHALRLREESAILHEMVRTYAGRALVNILLEQTGYRRSTFTGESLTSAYNEGRRDLGVWLDNWVFTTSPEALTIMRSEAQEREARYRAVVATQGEDD